MYMISGSKGSYERETASINSTYYSHNVLIYIFTLHGLLNTYSLGDRAVHAMAFESKHGQASDRTRDAPRP